MVTTTLPLAISAELILVVNGGDFRLIMPPVILEPIGNGKTYGKISPHWAVVLSLSIIQVIVFPSGYATFASKNVP
ncbi:hypothetical protein DRP07_00510 [Archaeoglobales archaeon]|nr:MAG: hypothetical protein DRP07_00510 [Archaeoglobales archaeon]